MSNKPENKNYKSKTIGAHKLKPESQMMTYGYDPHLSQGAVKPPVFLASTFTFKTAEEGEEFFNVFSGRKAAPEESLGGLIYSRFNNPNIEIIEDRLALLEGAERCAMFSSGMAAISSVLLTYLRPGDVVIQSTPLYGGTESLIRKFLPEFGIEIAELAGALHEDEILSSMREAAKKGRLAMVFFETPANPTNAMVNFEALNKALDTIESETGHRPISVCDNTLLGPVFQKAVPQGIDLSIYSVTKYIGGHSDLCAGAVCGSREKVRAVRNIRGLLGFNLDPHTSWMISRSLETLTIRMERAAQSASKVAQWLADNPYMKARILHPEFIQDADYQSVYARQCTGPGATFSFVMDLPKAQIFKIINALSLFKSAVSLGGSESLVCHPASTTHSGVPQELRQKFGVEEGLLRLSIGLEHPDDLIADLDNAFKIAFDAQKAA